MKKLFTCLIALIFAMASSGQLASHRINYSKAITSLPNSIINGQKNTNLRYLTEKTTLDTISRILAQVNHDYSPTLGNYPIDSIRVFWSGSNGLGGIYNSSYNPNNQIIARNWAWASNLPDSDYYFYPYDTLSNSYTLSGKNIYTLNAATKTFTLANYRFFSGNWVNIEQVIFKFDSYGNEILQTDLYWITYLSSWRPTYKDSFSYNFGTNNVNYHIGWSGFDTVANTYIPYSKDCYTYTTANKFLADTSLNWSSATSNWMNNGLYIYTYDGSNKVLSKFRSNWDTPSLTWTANPVVDNCIYDVSGYLVKDSAVIPSPIWANDYLMSYTNDINGNVILYTTSSWCDTNNNWYINYLDSNLYNSYNQLTFGYSGRYSGNNYFFNMIKYYYELHIADVKNILTQAGDAKLYPIPATEQINVAISWEEAQRSVITITDIAGRKIYEKNILVNKEFTEIIPVTSFTKGVYLLTIIGEKGSIIKKFAIE